MSRDGGGPRDAGPYGGDAEVMEVSGRATLTWPIGIALTEAGRVSEVKVTDLISRGLRETNGVDMKFGDGAVERGKFGSRGIEAYISMTLKNHHDIIPIWYIMKLLCFS